MTGISHLAARRERADDLRHPPPPGHWLKIFPPNQATAIYAHYDVQACSARLPAKLGSQLDVSVVWPGAGQAGQVP